MFWPDIPGGFALIISVCFLVHLFFDGMNKWVRRLLEKREERKSQQVFDLYRELQILSPKERYAYLESHSKRVRRRYEHAVSLWGEPK